MTLDEEYVSREVAAELLTPFLPLRPGKVAYKFRRGFEVERDRWVDLERSEAFYYELNCLLGEDAIWAAAKPDLTQSAIRKELTALQRVSKRLVGGLTHQPADGRACGLSGSARTLIERASVMIDGTGAVRHVPWEEAALDIHTGRLGMAVGCLERLVDWIDDALIMSGETGAVASDAVRLEDNEEQVRSARHLGDDDLDHLCLRLISMWVTLLGFELLWTWNADERSKCSPLFHFVQRVVRRTTAVSDCRSTLSAVRGRLQRLKRVGSFAKLEAEKSFKG